MKKKGISAVVATILIILIVVVGIGIVWKVILPLFAELEFLSYSDVRMNIVMQGYTIYDEDEHFAFVQIGRGADEVNVTGLEIGFNFDGTTKTYQTKVVPAPGGKHVYKFNFTNDSDMGIPQGVAPDKVTVAPVFIYNNKIRLGKILDEKPLPSGKIYLSAGEWLKANEEAAENIVVIHLGPSNVPGTPVNDTGDEDRCIVSGKEICGNDVDEDCENGAEACGQGYFTFQIDTSLISGTTFSFQADNADLSVDWGDGSNNIATGTGLISHTYSTNGVYNVSLNGSATRISYYEGTEDALINILTKVSDGVTEINNGYQMFRDTLNFGKDPLSEPAFFDDVSGGVTNMRYMFSTSQFNQDISNWNVASVTSMYAMFYDSQFNQSISGWDVSSVTDMRYMFSTSQFNQDISNWNVASVTSMYSMFSTSQFNQDISNWNVASVTSMYSMFYDSQFNQSISGWDVSSVTDMRYMFSTSQFNQDISNWNVASVTSMYAMFSTSQFNQDISNWDVSSVTSMGAMFYNSQFNQDISGWNVSSVTIMYAMFSTSQFNQDISGWNVSSVTSMGGMFYNSQLSTANYDSLLIGWASLPSLQTNVNFHAGSSRYCSGESARNTLINTHGWTITDGGKDCI